MPRSEVSWWLDWSALPDRLLWARLSVESNGSAVVLDCEGKHHLFSNEGTARSWLNEDEYSRMEHLVESGELPASVLPPTGSSEAELLRAMSSTAR